MKHNWPTILFRSLLIVCLIIIALAALFQLFPPAAPAGSSVQFDGRTIRLQDEASVKIDSFHQTTVYTDVTITTSQVTVTVWGKP